MGGVTVQDQKNYHNYQRLRGPNFPPLNHPTLTFLGHLLFQTPQWHVEVTS
jgi:hypothetical protein